MRRLFSAFPLNITRKLFLINILVLIMFSGIAGIITASQKRIEKISTEFIVVEFDQVIKNATLGRKLSDLKNRATLLVGAFYGNENLVDTEGLQLVNELEMLTSRDIPDSLEKPILNFREKLESLLTECSEVNGAAAKINTLNMEISMLLRNIEGNISENAVQATLAGKKDALVRPGLLIPSCRETLLEISVCFARIDPLYSNSLSDKSASIPGAINELYLRLGTIPLSSPAVADMVRQITDKVTLYREAFAAFDQASAELRKQEGELNRTMNYTSYVMERMDEQIINNAGIIQKKNVDDMRASLVCLYFLCGLAVILFGGFTCLFFLLTFRRPMTRICEGLDNIREGNLDTTIRLNRQDEWHFIEDAMNEMVSELRTSYSTLYDKNCQLAEAHQELESYMKELTDEIVERKRMEEALRESNQKFRSLSENAPDIIYTLGSNYAFTYVNPACEKVLGYKNPEIIGRFFTEFVQEDDSENYDRTFRRISDVREIIRNRDVVMVHRDGERRIFNMSGAPNFDIEGRFFGIVGILKDITEYRQLQVQIQQAQRMESISTLAGGVAHDFNNLMMGIQGRVSLMLIKTDINHPHFKHLKGIEDDIRRAADMTQQLLGFSRTRKSQISLLNMNEIIKKQNHIFGRTKREITIREKYEAELWPVEVDQSQIEQVFLNLYINAWQAMPGGGTLYVRTENTVIDRNYAELFRVAAGHYVKIAVTDTGTGMDDATRKRIFEPFFTTKEFGKGTGLGLFSTYSIVKNHDGFIHVYSETGKGSKFTIYLPAARYTEAKTENIAKTEENLALETQEAN